MKIIYLGPSGYKIDKTSLLSDWVVKPPCKQADIMKDLQTYSPQKICIVDGLYKTIPAPWHKELLLALENNVEVDGVGSLGALRAAELDELGMKGHGWIYNFIKQNEPIDDSIVALLHMDDNNNYKPITVAKIEIIHSFISQTLINNEHVKRDKAQELIEHIMHVNFEKLSNKYVANILKDIDPDVDWYRYLIDDFCSIKCLDTINYLEQEYVTKPSEVCTNPSPIKVERTNYIFRQKHLDLDTVYSDDLSDLNYTLQLYASYKFPEIYDIVCLETHLIFLCRLISELNYHDKLIENINIQWIKSKYADNAWHDDLLGLSTLSDGIYKEISENLQSQYPNKIFNLSDDEWLMYHNLYSSLEIYGNCKMIDSKTEKASRSLFINCLILTAIYEDFDNNDSELFIKQNSKINLNEKYRIICDLHRSFLELVKSTPVVAFHGGIYIQNRLKDHQMLIKDYKSSINKLSHDKVFALYSDTFSTEKRKTLLKAIQNLNVTRLLEVRPIHSIGTHFYNFQHLLLLLEELTND